MVKSLLRILGTTALVLASLVLGLRLVVTQPTIGQLAPRLAVRASAARLRTDVEFLSQSASPRDVQHPENLDRAASYLKAALEASGARVGEQVFTVRGQNFRNIVARLGPEGRHPLVVGAHYDAFGEAGSNPGADDNASGAAAVVELARILAHVPLQKPVELVAFATEEPPYYASPHMGSAVHARSLVDSGRAPSTMICLEMIGYFTPVQPWPSALLAVLYPRTGDFIALVGRWPDRALSRQIKRAMKGGCAVPVSSYNGVFLDGMDASDHRNYWARGIPAVMVTDTAFLRNPNYHAAGDTAETLDYARMAQVVDGVANAVVWLSSTQEAARRRGKGEEPGEH